MRKQVAYSLHSVIEGIGKAPQHKTIRILSDNEAKRKEYLDRSTPKNYIGDKIVAKVKRGRVQLRHTTDHERFINQLDAVIAAKLQEINK